MSTVLFEQKGHIGYVTMNRPEALNALNSETLSDLEKVLDAIDLDSVRCVVLTGAGEKAFVAGADVKEMAGFTPEEALAFGKKGNAVFRKLETLPVPVIAAINGFALGGGCELAMACDIRIASERASFAQPEAGLGITPGFGGTQRMSRLIGMERAKELIYTCRRVKADEALAIGLVSQVVPVDQLMDTAEKLAQTIAANVPFAVRACKAAMDAGAQTDIDRALDIEADAFSRCFTTEDRKEAMSAFVEKRPPAPFKNK